MKIITPLLSILIFVCCANAKQNTYVGSTPADTSIRSFLDIPLSDSVDFIRWKIVVIDNSYRLLCNYGVGKPNTNGFVNGGKKIELNGECKKDKNFYQFQNGAKTLKAVRLNADLIHLLNTDNSLLLGNAGWSYTLNNINPVASEEVSITATPTDIKDSVDFVGRTPCKILGVITTGSLCYKIKWHITLYAGTQATHPGTYKIFGTPWRKEGGKTGTWKITSGKNGRIIYQLNDDRGNGLLYLLKLDENILVFTDEQGKLLAGDEDFSYTLNRRSQ